MIACLGLLAYLYGKRLRGWVDAEVDGALPAAEAANADHLPIVGNMVEADPFCPTVNPLPDCSLIVGDLTVLNLMPDVAGRVALVHRCPDNLLSGQPG